MAQLTAHVPTAARLRLAHGALELIARESSVAILHIKGVALHEDLASGRPESSDCDILVHPDGIERFCKALESAHWRLLTHFAHGSVFAHAAAFHHDVWGTVDVHRWFPGLDRDPARTFNRFWEERIHASLGGVECPVPSLDLQRLLLLVHAARDTLSRSDHDLEVAWSALDETDKTRIDDLAKELGATVPLALVTGRPELAEGGRQIHLWTALHEKADARGIRIAMLRDVTSPRDAVELLREVIRVNPDHLALRLGRPPTSHDLRREWWARWPRWLRPAQQDAHSRKDG